MLQEVLSNHKPATWDEGPYNNKLYRKIQVFGNEHSRVIQDFQTELKTRVETVYRIQNPYIYGRYKLKVEQLQLRNTVYEETWYHPIAEDDMKVVMEYNCDYRRYTHPTWAQSEGKRPKFYKSAESAERNFSTSIRKALVVVKVANTHISTFTTCCKDWDTEYYPDYIVVLRE
ncbi:uncharacterized protein LOC111865187 isoform X2 [Cryptotermes secundus]|nr:uncharacterized protein LOC111865187 isoform X2 [Cryptotermes secundus]